MAEQYDGSPGSRPNPSSGAPFSPLRFGGRRKPGATDKPQNSWITLVRLHQYMKAEQNLLLLVFILVLTDALISLFGPYLVGVAVDAMAATGGMVDFSLLIRVLLALGAAYLLDGLLMFAQGWLVTGAAQRIVRRLRSVLFAKLQNMPLHYFDTHSHGETMSTLSNDVDNVSNTLSQSVTQLMSGGIAIVGSLAMMVLLSPLLTAASLITVPLVMLLSAVIARKTALLFREQQSQLARLNAAVEESITGLEVIQAFNYEEKAVRRFTEVNEALCNVGIKAQIWSGFLMPLMNVINNIGMAAIAFVGAMLAIQGSISIGVIASFLGYSRQFVRPINEIANIYNVLQSGVAGAERIFAVLDEEEEPADGEGKVVLDKPHGQVVFDNVSFGYQPGLPVLKNVSLVTEAGSCTALVGPTGAGKTTLIHLLTRFYDVTAGRILLDGRDIRDYTRDSLRRSFGIVLQDTYLFSGTIRENIKYARPDAGDAEVAAAAEMANAAGFIKKLPQQYDTVLTENGGNLSQGQRQLLAIARVILANPSILILDEATSSIDTRTERHIQDALHKLMQGRTTFVIAHRLNTIRYANQILVVRDGEIAEKGNHDELLHKRGLYYQMVCALS